MGVVGVIGVDRSGGGDGWLYKCEGIDGGCVELGDR